MVAFDLYHPSNRHYIILGRRIRIDHHDRRGIDRNRDLIDTLFKWSIRRAKHHIRHRSRLITDLGSTTKLNSAI